MPKIDYYSKNGKIYNYMRVESKLPDLVMDKSVTGTFSGHRPSDMYGYRDASLYKPLEDRVEKYIIYLHELGFRQLITGGAQGFDQLVFWCIDRVKNYRQYKDLLNTVYVPYEGQESAWIESGLFKPSDYYRMLDKADRVKVVNRNVNPGDPYGYIVAALDARNKEMLRDSSLLTTWYNGKGSGGTHNAIVDARIYGMEVVNLYEETTR